MITVRLFAAARDAAGTDSVQIPADVPLAAALAELGLGDRFTRVLAACTLMCEGRRIGATDALPDGAVVDVLPPFAGG